MSRPTLSLADELSAAAKLLPQDAATRELMLAMLSPRESLGEVKGAARRAASMPTTSNELASVPSLLHDRDEQIVSAPPVSPAKPPVRRASRAATRIRRLPREPFLVPTTVSHSFGRAEKVPERTPHPIIAPKTARAILASLASGITDAATLDLQALIARISRGEPVVRMPMRSAWTLRRGAQLLIDCSRALAPLASDVEWVEQRLRDIVGNTRLQCLYFAGCPTRGVGSGERSKWREWRAPAPGVPVILLTDLGCAGPWSDPEWSSPREWIGFAARAYEFGAKPVALVPYPVHRVPLVLARQITVVPWHESVDVGKLRRILHDARTSRSA